MKVKKEETSFAPDITVTEREYSKSEASMRELSGRNLMEESFNRSQFHPSKVQKENKSMARGSS